MSFTGFYWFELVFFWGGGFTGFNWMLLGFTGFYFVSLYVNELRVVSLGSYWVLPSFPGCYRVSLVFFYWFPPNIPSRTGFFTEFYWVAQDFTGLHVIAIDFTDFTDWIKFYRVLLNKKRVRIGFYSKCFMRASVREWNHFSEFRVRRFNSIPYLGLVTEFTDFCLFTRTDRPKPVRSIVSNVLFPDLFFLYFSPFSRL